MTDQPAPASSTARKVGKTAALIWGLFIVGFIVLVLGAIAGPKFIAFSCKSKQSEAKTNLAGIYTAEKAYFGQHSAYSADFEAIQWAADGTPLYRYGFDGEEILAAVPDAGARDDGFLVVAVANIDTDDTLDVWTIDHNRELVSVTNDCVD